MCPDVEFLGMSLYSILILVGVVLAFIMFTVYTSKLKLPNKLINFCLVISVLTVVFGYFCAVLFQAFYNWPVIGKFEINADTGATFYGGLIGGAAMFFTAYFLGGKFIFKEKENIKYFNHIVSVAACCVLLAHGFGRIGCLMDGCCYGLPSEKFGIYMPAVGAKVLPTQLYEAVFLFILCAVLSVLLLKYKKLNLLALYFIAYGVWRFGIEYLRDDYRGETFIAFLTPSQLTAIVLVLAGVGWYVFVKVIRKPKIPADSTDSPCESDASTDSAQDLSSTDSAQDLSSTDQKEQTAQQNEKEQ